ncbi:MAG: prephenate dehydrogenase/arogenate dehydrogenase family protein [Endomicrobiales bacterium]|nr:prephenate dehydrogenase/arogenate dehydrogenase family protein [Endomicrobiales bacterium]
MQKKKIAIIGVGLIGGSLGLALKRRRAPYNVIGVGRNIKKLKLAKKLGAVDGYTLDWSSGVKDSDIIVVCTPVDIIASTIKRIKPFLKKRAIITDVGSVKGSVLKEIKRLDPKKMLCFVGAHPLAGLEKNGVKHAKNDLYTGAAVVIAADSPASGNAIAEIKRMWGSAGADVIAMNSGVHDKIVAVTSHMPHVLAYGLSSAVFSLAKRNKNVSKLLAGSFRDLTRIADSNPNDWAAICGKNHIELNKALGSYINQLSKIRKELYSQRKLEKVFKEAKLARQKLLNIN